jgi:2-octaprenyl-6-methoxyphenol hydroxylase
MIDSMSNLNALTASQYPQIAILGAGPIGLACAILLLERNPDLHLHLFDKFPLENTLIEQGDERGIAISEGSKQLLQSMDAWHMSAPTIHEVHISQRHHFGQTIIRKEELQKDALGYIVRYKDIHLQLRLRLKALQSICVNFVWEFDSTISDLDKMPPTTCCIHAEGGLFHQQESKDRRVDYEQSALVGWLETKDIQENIAWERFTSEGPIALLPHHGGKNTRNLVWCATPDRINHLMQLDAPKIFRRIK